MDPFQDNAFRIIVFIGGVILTLTPILLQAWGIGLTWFEKILSFIVFLTGAYLIFLAVSPQNGLILGKVLLLLVQTKWRFILFVLGLLFSMYAWLQAEAKGRSFPVGLVLVVFFLILALAALV